MPERHSRYEADNTAVRPVLVILLMTVVLIPLLSFAVWLAMGAIQSREEASSRMGQGPIPTDRPVLQRAPQTDLAEWKQQQTARLNSTGWVDQDAGVVHIPIDQAMDLLVERGLPNTDQNDQEEDFP